MNPLIHVIAVGVFGEEVARRVSQMRTNVVVTMKTGSTLPPPAVWPMAGIHVVAAWRPVPGLAELMDELSHAWKVPWIMVVQDHPYLQIGPVVVPGKSACYGCFQRRYLQHSHSPDLARNLLDHYRQAPTSGPAGFLPSFAGFAAAVLEGVLDQVKIDATADAGVVRRMHVFSGAGAVSTVVGIHGCPRCGLTRDEQTRSYGQLGADLTAMGVLPITQGKEVLSDESTETGSGSVHGAGS